MIQRPSVRSAPILFLLGLSCASNAEIESMLSVVPNVAVTQEWHVGPSVHLAETGPARFVPELFDAYDAPRAIETVRFADLFYRAPANAGYDEVLDYVAEELRKAGFGSADDRLTLEVLEAEPEIAWTPFAANLTLLADGEKERVLHAFESEEQRDRVMLPVHAPSCAVEGDVVLSLNDIKKGNILVTDVSASQVLRRAKSRGAAAVVSASLASFNEDPSGAERHLDAIQFRTLASGTEMPVAQISRNSYVAIEEAVDRAAIRNRPVRLRFTADVAVEERPLRTLVATVRGSERPDEVVAVVSHVQEPGANDNGSGVAGLLESARSFASLLRKERISWPDRSIAFIWGDEFAQSETWLEHTDATPVAAISSDMTGQSADTGAIALLERMPDPGALFTLPPDAHTPWGAGEVDSESLQPNGFALIARCAMVDVGLIDGTNWRCADHPWEGGSDHDVFIARGVPAVLFWHFTDFTYHTSLDRMEFVDPTEIRRTSVAILASALAVADAEPGDLERYLMSLDLEREVRIEAARDVDDQGLEVMWNMWCDGARNWLRKLCLGTDDDLPDVEHGGDR